VAATTTQRRTALGYIPALDGIRGLLVFPVVLYHFSITAGVLAADGRNGLLVAPGSWLAPSMFFTLSGFLITSLLLAERERTGTVDWRGFWSRRFRRLLPASLGVIFLCTLIKALWPSVYGPLPASDVLAGIFSVKNWQSIHLESGTTAQQLRLLGPLSPYWSLAVEEQFYLGLSVVIALALRTRRATGWLVTFLVGLWCYSALSLFLIDGSANRMFFGTDTRASEVVSGCLLAVVVARFGWPQSRRWSLVGWIGLAATVVAWAKLGETDAWVIHGGLLLASVLNLALILGGLVEGGFARAMSFRPLIELGKLSYPVYLIHWPVSLVLQPDRMGFAGWPLIGVRFVVSVLLGYALSEWLERPIRSRRALPGRQGTLLWASAATASVVLALWRGSL
jgi:peptidoglycan/LPS O-acetylase OafA/YrhL